MRMSDLPEGILAKNEFRLYAGKNLQQGMFKENVATEKINS